MKWKIEYSSLYLRKARKILKGDPKLKDIYTEFLNKLITNPLEPSLQTHPLSGSLKGKFACALTYKLRIVFEITDKTILLLNIGTHDEVY